MFDITSSKLFLLAIVALLVIGPKDFPVLLRTIGKYVGIIRGHAKEFRAQFDEAMRETEFAQLKKDMENIAQETEASLNATGREVEQTLNEAAKGMEASFDNPLAPVADTPAPDAGANVDSAPAEPAPPALPTPAETQTGETQTAAKETEGPAAAPPAHAASEPPPASASERTGA
jgi:sec-independent protein translocase protein TatB